MLIVADKHLSHALSQVHLLFNFIACSIYQSLKRITNVVITGLLRVRMSKNALLWLLFGQITFCFAFEERLVQDFSKKTRPNEVDNIEVSADLSFSRGKDAAL